jgi:hypothetical protein
MQVVDAYRSALQQGEVNVLFRFKLKERMELTFDMGCILAFISVKPY